MHDPMFIPVICPTCHEPVGGMVCNEGIAFSFCERCRVYVICAYKDGHFSQKTTHLSKVAMSIVDDLKEEMEDPKTDPKYDGIRKLELD